MAAVEKQTSTPAMTTATTWALALAFTSFVIPIVPAVVAIVIAAIHKTRLDRSTRAGATNAKMCTIAQLTSVFTLALVGGFVWWTWSRFG